VSRFRALLDNYGVGVILFSCWALGLTTIITIKVFFDPPDIPAGTVAAFGTFFVLPPVVLKAWQWWRDRG
tara:strand:+ start:860 stop:1069 length:210 start_codon:yes stop_codon:yes gene_type:complete